MNRQNSNMFLLIFGLIGVILLIIFIGTYILLSNFQNIPMVNTPQSLNSTSSPLPAIETPLSTKATSYDERFYFAQPYINDALQKMAGGNFSGAVIAWDQALELIPEYAEGYYQRGLAYLNLSDNEHNQEIYLVLLNKAYEDIDLAIALDTTNNGNYYYARFRVYDSFASSQEYRVDYIPLKEIALDNLLISYQFDTTENLANRAVLFVLYQLGRCEEMLAETEEQLALQIEPSATLTLSLGLSAYCSGDFETALQFTTEALRIGKEKQLLEGYCQRSFSRAQILYSLKKYDEALSEISENIETDPYFCGYRYYLRGLIYASIGDIENAEKDLLFGMGQTWSRGGLLAYAQAKIAIQKGDIENAIYFLQQAEATYHVQDPILKMMQDELESLGGTTLVISPKTLPIFTPIVIPAP